MSAFKIDESKLRKADRVRLNIRRLVVERLEHLRNNVANAAEAREVDAAALICRPRAQSNMLRTYRRGVRHWLGGTLKRKASLLDWRMSDVPNPIPT